MREYSDGVCRPDALCTSVFVDGNTQTTRERFTAKLIETANKLERSPRIARTISNEVRSNS